MIKQLLPQIPLDTPKGKALAYFLIDMGVDHDLQWVCFIDETRECWTFRNKEIRARENITMGRVNKTFGPMPMPRPECPFEFVDIE